MSDVEARPGVIHGGPQVLRKRLLAWPSLIVPLIGSVFAFRHLVLYGITWIDVLSYSFFYIVTGLGVTIGLHRLFTHRSFKAHPIAAWTLGILAAMSAQTSLRTWVADHRRHHANTDRTTDPHSPHYDTWGADVKGFRGFIHSHCGWLVDGTVTDMAVHGKNLDDDPVIRIISKTHLIWLALTLALPYGFGYLLGGADAAWSSLLFGGFVRIAAQQQATMSVNSFGHIEGFRHFKTRDTSTNNWVLAFVTGGEGWHNNHHRFPRSYRNGLYAGEIDASAAVIRWMERVGLASDLVDNSGIDRKMRRKDDPAVLAS